MEKHAENRLGIYVHIPFCVRKCGYCDFLSFPADEEAQRSYIEALLAEIRASGADRPAASVFIGGGTPSVLPAEWIAEILGALQERFAFAEDAEITAEANPGTLQKEKLREYRRAGVNRLSLGCQSVHEAELASLGRIHTFDDLLQGFRLARREGFGNINLDLMFGIPGQTAASWEQSLRRAAELAPEHISAYSLILEEGTPFYGRYAEDPGRGDAACAALPSEDAEREMFESAAAVLAEYGYEQYEISNYAKPGSVCRHNVGYWTGMEYLGFGLGAASFTYAEGEGTGLPGGADARAARRYKNTESMEEYLRCSSEPLSLRREEQYLDKRDLEAEYMILGLRMTAGVSAAEFEGRFGEPMETVFGEAIRKHTGHGLLERAPDPSGGRLRLTRQGLSLANAVMADLL